MKDRNLNVVHKASGEVKQHPSIEEKTLYNILEKLPAPKKEMNLSKDQKKCWYWFGKEFLTTKQFMQLDLIHLQNAAIWLDARNKAIAKINSLNEQDPDGVLGWVQTFANGTNNVTGYVTILDKAAKHLDEVSAHFGLSIKDRQKIKSVETDNGQLSLFDKVLNQLNQAQ